MRKVYTVIKTSLSFTLLCAAVVYGDVEPPTFDSPLADVPATPVVNEPSAQDDLPAATEKVLPAITKENLDGVLVEEPKVDVPADTPEKVDLPSATEELSDLESIRPPADLPLTKEALDSAGKVADPLPLKPAQKPTQSTAGQLFLSPLENVSPTIGAQGSAVGAPASHGDGTGQIDKPVSDSHGADVFPLANPHGGEPMYTDTLDLLPMYDDATSLGSVTPSLDCQSFGGGWDFGGWLSGGTTLNAHGNRTSTGNAPMGFNNYADGLILNQAWAFLEKETQTGGCGFDWGFRMDFVFGADAPDTQAFRDGSWDASWDTGGEYGFAMPQFYGEISFNRTKTRFGRFLTTLGYEIVPAPHNFFYSHSYSRYYNQPFTHTGFLTQYDLKSDLSLFGGWTAGWDSGFENRNDGSTFLGGAIWNVSECFDVLYAASAGDPGDVRNASSDAYVHSLIGDYRFGYGWNYVFQWDYQTLESSGGPRTDSHAINQYLFKQLRQNLSVGTRIEYFRDEDGVRIGNGPGEYYGATFGVNWRPLDRMVLRPEIRWDWFDGAGLPFDDNTTRSQFTFGMDAVYVF